MSYTRPPLAVFIDFVKRYDKRVGLRKMYKDFAVPAELRANYRDMWDKIAEEIKYAGEKQETETSDDDGAPRAGQGEVGQPWCPTDEPEPATRVCSNEQKTAKKPKKKKTKKKTPE